MEITDWKDESCRKSRRVRSWYLYEQFKSIEKSELDAARKLKHRSYQDRLLHRELNERRTRRRLCDQFGLCQSESKLGRGGVTSKTLLSTSSDDLYESFCRLHNEDDIYSCDESQTSKTYQECSEAYTDEFSHVDSVTSVIQNFNFDDNLTDNIKEDMQSVQKNIAENINMQLETVKENLECIEKYTKMCDEGKESEVESFNSIDASVIEVDPAQGHLDTEYKSKLENFLSIWSKLVNFSYRTMQLSCGNCYNDYGTQLLVAVLACDMLRRGLNKMCYVLQPYTSPVKFSASEPEITTKTYKNVKYDCKKRKTIIKSLPTRHCNKNRKLNRSEGAYSTYRLHAKKSHGQSEPGHSIGTTNPAEKSISSFWPDDLNSPKSICKCQQVKSVVNSMMELSQQLDNVIREVQSVNYCA